MSNMTIESPVEKTNLGVFSMSLVVSSIGLLSILSTLMNIFIFSNAQFKEKLFTFIKLESIFMCSDLSIIIMLPFYYCKDCSFSKSLAYCINWKYFQVYLTSLCEMCALISSILASFTCLVSNFSPIVKFKPIIDLNPYLVSVVSFVTSGLLFMFQLFQYNIQKNIDGTFYLIDTEFRDSQLNNILQLMSFSIRDCLLIVILVVLNVFMMKKAKELLKNKARILKKSTFKSAERTSKDGMIKKSQNKLIKLLVFDSMLYVLSRIPLVVYFVVINLIFNYSSEYIEISLSLIVSVSYGLKFLIYFKFNKKFRNVFKQTLLNLNIFKK